ncbi:MAG: ABC transporter ATP-binding protein [Terriglobales bacterium]
MAAKVSLSPLNSSPSPEADDPAPAILASHLRKQYGGCVAVENLTLEVGRGEVFGLLGSNGAGKSTSLKLLLGLVHPSAGEALVLGRPLGDIHVRRKIGFLPEHFCFQDWLSGAELLRLHGRLYGMPEDLLRRRIPELLARIGLATQGSKPLREYSKGMRQRLGLAQALLNDPDLIFLDEPTSGLDPHGCLLVRELIREQHARGATVFLNSHLLGEVEVSCTRVAFMKQGRVVATRSLNEESGSLPVRLRAHLSPVQQAVVSRFALGDVSAPSPAESDLWRFELPGRHALPLLLRALVAANAEVYELTAAPQTLEEMFLRVVGQEENPA